MHETGGEPNEERIEWLKRLRKGGGLAQPRVGVPLGLFGAEDWEGLTKNVMLAWSVAGIDRQSFAIGRALNIDGVGGNLSERRALPDLHGETVPLRTVIRREEAAIRVLDRDLGYLISRFAFDNLVARATWHLELALTRPMSSARRYDVEKVTKALELLRSKSEQRGNA